MGYYRSKEQVISKYKASGSDGRRMNKGIRLLNACKKERRAVIGEDFWLFWDFKSAGAWRVIHNALTQLRQADRERCYHQQGDFRFAKGTINSARTE